MSSGSFSWSLAWLCIVLHHIPVSAFHESLAKASAGLQLVLWCSLVFQTRFSISLASCLGCLGKWEFFPLLSTTHWMKTLSTLVGGFGMSLKNRDQRTLEPGPYCLPVLATPSSTPWPLLRFTDTHLCLGSYMANQSHLLALTPYARTTIVDTADGSSHTEPSLTENQHSGSGFDSDTVRSHRAKERIHPTDESLEFIWTLHGWAQHHKGNDGAEGQWPFYPLSHSAMYHLVLRSLLCSGHGGHDRGC